MKLDILTTNGCDLDYSIYNKTHNVNDVGWICNGVRFAEMPVDTTIRRIETTSATQNSQTCSWMETSWRCTSTGTKVGVYIVLGLVALFLIKAVQWSIQANETKKRANDPSTPEFRAVANNKYRSELNEKKQILEIVENIENIVNEIDETGFITNEGEEILLMVSGVALVESKRLPSTFTGGSSGLSYRLTKRVTVRTGAVRGQSVQGAEVPGISDTGQFVITTKRAVFTGTKQSREFLYSKLLSVSKLEIAKGATALFLPVSNRKTVSGIGADIKSLETIQLRLNIALKLMRVSKDELVANLKSEIETLESNPPPGFMG